jgi:hypothetical protein
MTLFQSSADIFRIGLSLVMPALLTRMSSRPCCSMTSRTTRLQSSQSPTLPRWMLPFAPASSIDLRCFSAASSLEE